jgi:hypothetical protein
MKISVKKCVLGRPVAKQLIPIKNVPKEIDVGYGPGQLRPDGSRQPETERVALGNLNQLINGMSGQQTG